mmetsp:Transcript_22481/g.53420  ORF Transcript_22481/g.53420 Transcript_22481/m.53420 type:complete len:227 (+) Transcript_22481:4698-5378(+)
MTIDEDIHILPRDLILRIFVRYDRRIQFFPTSMSHFFIHRTRHRIRYGRGVRGRVFHHDASKVVRLVVADVSFLVGDCFAHQTNRYKEGDRAQCCDGMKSGAKQPWETRSNPHDDTHNQKVHVGKSPKLVPNGDRKKVQVGVPRGDEGVVASRVIRLSRNQQPIAPVFLSELDDVLADDLIPSASTRQRHRGILGRHGSKREDERLEATAIGFGLRKWCFTVLLVD